MGWNYTYPRVFDLHKVIDFEKTVMLKMANVNFFPVTAVWQVQGKEIGVLECSRNVPRTVSGLFVDVQVIIFS